MVRPDPLGPLSDVPLDRDDVGSRSRDGIGAPPGGPEPRAPALSRLLLILLVLGAVAGVLYFVWIARRPAPNAVPAPTTSTEVPVAPTTAVTIPDEPLPPLVESDSFLRRMVALLSAHPTLTRWLATDGLIQRAASAVEQAGDGSTPDRTLRVMRPDRRGTTLPRGNALIIDPASYRRWDDLTAAITSVDPAAAAALYRHIRPLFVETYREMGHPDGNFDAAIGRAAGRLLATPIERAPLVVEARRGYVEHQRADLRALPGVSRQWLLLGPDNLARLQEWTTRFLQAATIEPR